jgi:hypothetical protein
MIHRPRPPEGLDRRLGLLLNPRIMTLLACARVARPLPSSPNYPRLTPVSPRAGGFDDAGGFDEGATGEGFGVEPVLFFVVVPLPLDPLFFFVVPPLLPPVLCFPAFARASASACA